MNRGEVWLCTLDPTVGSEIRKTRPCLIVSPDDMNGRLQTVIVAPLTSGGRSTRFRVPVTFERVAGLIVPDQLQALDKRRLVKPLGRVGETTLAAALTVLSEMFSS